MRAFGVHMRALAGALAAAVLMGPSAAQSFEAELERYYPPAGPSEAALRVVGSTDIDAMDTLIREFQHASPGLGVSYVQASSAELYGAIDKGAPHFDLAISAAMDLQTKLANDGRALTYRSDATEQLPDWARWRDQVFAFTEEAVVIVYARDAFDEDPPLTRADLARSLRADPERFRGKVATYDPMISGFGYLLATQDARQSETFWSLAELFGATEATLSCCSSELIDGVASGRFLIAYNALSPYAMRRVREGADIVVVEPEDYTHVMLRTALIPVNSGNPEVAGAFIDFLLSSRGRGLLAADAALPPLNPNRPLGADRLRPITLGPGLLVYLDRLKKERFLAAWNAAVVER